MTWLDFTIGSLATFRLALLVSREDGPAFVFRWLRQVPDKGTATHKGISCTLCTSMYSSALVATAYWWLELLPPWQWSLYWLAFSAAAIAAHMSFTKGI